MIRRMKRIAAAVVVRGVDGSPVGKFVVGVITCRFLDPMGWIQEGKIFWVHRGLSQVNCRWVSQDSRVGRDVKGHKQVKKGGNPLDLLVVGAVQLTEAPTILFLHSLPRSLSQCYGRSNSLIYSAREFIPYWIELPWRQFSIYKSQGCSSPKGFQGKEGECGGWISGYEPWNLTHLIGYGAILCPPFWQHLQYLPTSIVKIPFLEMLQSWSISKGRLPTKVEENPFRQNSSILSRKDPNIWK